MKKEQYSLLHKRFVEKYANPMSKTFGNATKSYQKAGYKVSRSNAQCASTLLNTKKIQRMLKEYEPPSGQLAIQRVDISKDYALARLQETYEDAKDNSDRAVQLGCVRLMMQHNNMLTERLVVTHTDAIELEEQFGRQCKQIANIIIENGGCVPESLPPAIEQQQLPEPVEAEFVELTGT